MTTLLPFHLLHCLLLLSFLSLLPSISAQSGSIDFTQLSISSITSPQCTSIGGSAVNCTLPAQLTVRIAGLPPNATLSGVVFLFTSANGDLEWADYTYFSTPSSGQFNVSLEFEGYNPTLFSGPLTLALQDYRSGNTSQPFKGLWVAYIPPPHFASIAGCQGNGASTLLCVPDRDSLTFYGSGFLLFNALSGSYLTIGNASGWIYAVDGLQVQSDSQMTLFLNSSYGFILTISHYTGVALPLSFNLKVWSSKRGAFLDYLTDGGLSVSFGPLPPPIVLAAEPYYGTDSDFCRRPANVTANTFVNMIPETCLVYVYGHYLYYAQGYLTSPGKGSYPCLSKIGAQYAQYMYCFLPLLPAGVDQPGLAWDLLVQTTAGSVTLPGAVTFTTVPVITSLVPCTAFASVFNFNGDYAGCQPGSVLVMHATNFPTNGLPLLQLSNLSSVAAPVTPSTVNVTCGQAAQLTANSWSCVIPSMDPPTALAFYGQLTSIRAFFPSTGQSTPAVRAFIVAYPDSPVITSVSGCEVSNGSLVVSRCRSGDVLTIAGTSLNSSSAVVTFWDPMLTNSWLCTLLQPLTATSVQCRLPVVTQGDSDLAEGEYYEMNWYDTRPGNGFTWANPFTLSFTWDPLVAPSSGGSSSSTNVTAILAGVLVPVGVIAALVVAWLLYRRLHAVKRGSSEDAGRGDAFSNLEMK